MLDVQDEFPGIQSVLRYRGVARMYAIHTLVIGQCPYDTELLPFLGSAFSQAEGTPDTPTLEVFVSHFDDCGPGVARGMMRNTWRLLQRGYCFVNADWLPTSQGGGDGSAQCILRVSLMKELLVSYVQHWSPQSLKVISMGNVASSMSSELCRRLRAMKVKVSSNRCSMPTYLSSITCNRHLVGKDGRYVFCSQGVGAKLKAIVEEYPSVSTLSHASILRGAVGMSGNVSRQTTSALEYCSANTKQALNTLQSMKTTSSSNIEDNVEVLKATMISIAESLDSICSCITVDSAIHSSIIHAGVVQLPAASTVMSSPAPTETGISVSSSQTSRSVVVSRRSPRKEASSPASMFTIRTPKSRRNNTTPPTTPATGTMPTDASSP